MTEATKNGPTLTPADIERFNSHVDKGNGDGCWVWTAAKEKGYGRMGFRKRPAFAKTYAAHRLAWLIEYGTWPDLFVCHACDNPSCVRPDHLWLGTHQDNMIDCGLKNRVRKSRVAMEGRRFGRLVAHKVAGKDNDGNLYWECICDCGATVAVYGTHLRTGRTMSCGCASKRGLFTGQRAALRIAT